MCVVYVLVTNINWRHTAWLEVYWLEVYWLEVYWWEVYWWEVYIISSRNSIPINGTNKLKIAGPNVYTIFKNQYNNEQRI